MRSGFGYARYSFVFNVYRNIKTFGVIALMRAERTVGVAKQNNRNNFVFNTGQISGRLDKLFDDRFTHEMRLDSANAEIQKSLGPLVLQVFKLHKGVEEDGLTLDGATAFMRQHINRRIRTDDVGLVMRTLTEEGKLRYIGSTNKYEYTQED